MKKFKGSQQMEDKNHSINEDAKVFSETSLIFFEEETFSDVTLIVGENKEEIKAHKIILASRSEVFKAMFCGTFTEQSGRVEIPDIQPGTLKTLLRYMYSGEFEEPTEDSVVSLLYAAEKYGVRGFSNKCGLFLQKIISSQNFCSILNLATVFNKEAVLRECLLHSSLRGSNIVNSDSFLSLSKESLKVLLGSDHFYADELSILRACIRWAENECDRNEIEKNQTNIRGSLGPILQMIRFTSIPVHLFSSTVSKMTILTDAEKIAFFQSFIEKSDEYKKFNFTDAQKRVTAKLFTCVRHTNDIWKAEKSKDYIQINFDKDAVLVALNFLIPNRGVNVNPEKYAGNVMIHIRDRRDVFHSQTIIIHESTKANTFFLRPCLKLKANKDYIIVLFYEGDNIVLNGRKGYRECVRNGELTLTLGKPEPMANGNLRIKPIENEITSFEALGVIIEQ